jgi:hypothetical protein
VRWTGYNSVSLAGVVKVVFPGCIPLLRRDVQRAWRVLHFEL